MNSATGDIQYAGCCRVSQRPEPDPDEQLWACSLCDAKIWVADVARQFLADNPTARPACYQCVSKLLLTGGTLSTKQY